MQTMSSLQGLQYTISSNPFWLDLICFENTIKVFVYPNQAQIFSNDYYLTLVDDALSWLCFSVMFAKSTCAERN